MNALIMTAQLILGLSILVILHELGHYLAARAFGIRVEKFFLFFDAWGFKLFSFKKGDTEYGVGWLPLGGYVKIAGMIDESLDKEQLNQPPQPWEFRSKPAWQRLIVMIGGVTVNLVLGILLFAFILLRYEKEFVAVSEVNLHGIYASEAGREVGFQTGDKILAINGQVAERFKDVQSMRNLFGSTITVERNGKPIDIVIPEDFYKKDSRGARNRFVEALNFDAVVDSVLPGLPAALAGFQKGDRIVSLDSVALANYGQFRDLAAAMAGKTYAVALIRGGDTLTTNVSADSTGLVGITVAIPYKPTPYSFFSAMSYGYSDAMDMLVINVKGLGKVFSGKEKATDSIQGPIGIAQIYGSQWVWSKFWFITALLSLILAFMNILPIPALDGGHVMFLMYEMVTRRKPSDKFMENAQIVGMVILLGIMVFAVGNDIFKIFK